MITRRAALLSAAAMAAMTLHPGTAWAAYPEKTIRLIVPYSAGGPADFVARLLAQRMQDVLNQTVIVENRPGGNVIIGASAVAAAEKDGYTLLFDGRGTFLQTLLTKTPYQAADLVPISTVGRFPFVVVTRPDLGAKTPKDLVEVGRKLSDGLTYAHTGNGTLAQLMGEMVFETLDIPARGVPYKGASQAMTDLIAGRIDISMDALVNALPRHKAGQVRIAGILGTERFPEVPEIPTFVEAGYPKLALYGWTALFAPAGTPRAVVDTLSAAVHKAMDDPETKKKMKDAGQSSWVSTPAEAQKVLDADISTWTPYIKRLSSR